MYICIFRLAEKWKKKERMDRQEDMHNHKYFIKISCKFFLNIISTSLRYNENLLKYVEYFNKTMNFVLSYDACLIKT